MADDTEINIRLTGESSSAVSAINNTSNSLGALGMSGAEVSRKFDHVALRLFNREMLDTVGFGGNAREVMTALSIAESGLVGSMGAAVNAIFPYVAILGTAAMVIQKVVSQHKEHKVSLDDVIKSEETELRNTEDLNTALTDYAKTLDGMPQEYRNLSTELKAYTKDQEKLLALDLRRKAEELTDAITKQEAANKKLLAAESSKIPAEVRKNIEDTAKALGLQTEAQIRAATSTAGLQLHLTQINDELARYEKTGKLISDKDYFKKNTESAKDQGKALEELTKLSKKLLKEEVDGQKAVEAAEEERFKNRMTLLDRSTSALDGYAKLAGAKGVEMRKTEKALLIASAIGNTYAGAARAFHDYAWPYSAFIAGGVVSAGMANVAEITSHATGTDRIVTSPQLFQAGEGGQPERVTVTPLGGGAGDPGAGGDTYHIGPFNVNGAQDPMQFAAKVMAYISQQTRGRGQIKPVGASIY